MLGEDADSAVRGGAELEVGFPVCGGGFPGREGVGAGRGGADGAGGADTAYAVEGGGDRCGGHGEDVGDEAGWPRGRSGKESGGMFVVKGAGGKDVVIY